MLSSELGFILGKAPGLLPYRLRKEEDVLRVWVGLCCYSVSRRILCPDWVLELRRQRHHWFE